MKYHSRVLAGPISLMFFRSRSVQDVCGSRVPQIKAVPVRMRVFDSLHNCPYRNTLEQRIEFRFDTIEFSLDNRIHWIFSSSGDPSNGAGRIRRHIARVPWPKSHSKQKTGGFYIGTSIHWPIEGPEFPLKRCRIFHGFMRKWVNNCSRLTSGTR